jgi:hypothetical protein
MVGLNISLRFIFKPSYSPHFANTHVGGNFIGRKNKMTKLIIIGVLTVGTMVFLGTYEGFNLLYFEENTADNYALYGAIPILVLVAIFLFADRYNHSIKDNRLFDAIKYTLGGLFSIGLLYYFILVPVISGTIILTNDILGAKENILVTGVVVDKLEIDGAKLSEYELTIKTNLKTITWDTNKIETSKYKIGDNFNMEMRKGLWGLLTKEK